MTYAKFGGFQHPNDELVLTKFEAIPFFNDRNQRLEVRYRCHAYGELLYEGAQLQTKINELINAYSIPNQHFGLYLDDGTLTRHKLDPNDPAAVSGVMVTH